MFPLGTVLFPSLVLPLHVRAAVERSLVTASTVIERSAWC